MIFSLNHVIKLENNIQFGPKWSVIVTVYAKKNCKKNRCQRHFVAQSILDKQWKFQHHSSNGAPIWSNCAKAVAQFWDKQKQRRLKTCLMAILHFYLFHSIVLHVGCRYFLCTVSTPNAYLQYAPALVWHQCCRSSGV